MVSNSNGFLNGKPGKARQGGFDAGAGFNKLGEFVVPGKMLKKLFVQKTNSISNILFCIKCTYTYVNLS